jgi:D-3-phosphoglycerate dehydrogenase
VKSAWGLSGKVQYESSLDNLLSNSDYISIHPPLNDETRGMFNADRFAAMKKGIKIMNFARGGLVNNEDLLAAIKKGTVDCYVTDFPEEELLGNDHIIPIPHLGASTAEAEENCAVMAVEQLKDFLEKGIVRNSVNFPDCDMEPTEGQRIVITNKNIPNMVGQITTALANQNINIANMLNRHQGEYAITIIDVETTIDNTIIGQLKNILGVITVRLL